MLELILTTLFIIVLFFIEVKSTKEKILSQASLIICGLQVSFLITYIYHLSSGLVSESHLLLVIMGLSSKFLSFRFRLIKLQDFVEIGVIGLIALTFHYQENLLLNLLLCFSLIYIYIGLELETNISSSLASSLYRLSILITALHFALGSSTYLSAFIMVGSISYICLEKFEKQLVFIKKKFQNKAVIFGLVLPLIIKGVVSYA